MCWGGLKRNLCEKLLKMGRNLIHQQLLSDLTFDGSAVRQDNLKLLSVIRYLDVPRTKVSPSLDE